MRCERGVVRANLDRKKYFAPRHRHRLGEMSKKSKARIFWGEEKSSERFVRICVCAWGGSLVPCAHDSWLYDDLMNP